MAVLSDERRGEIYAAWVADIGDRGESFSIEKPAARALVAAVDQWVNDHSNEAFAGALTAEQSATLSYRQLASLFHLVVAKRTEIL